MSGHIKKLQNETENIKRQKGTNQDGSKPPLGALRRVTLQPNHGVRVDQNCQDLVVVESKYQR